MSRTKSTKIKEAQIIETPLEKLTKTYDNGMKECIFTDNFSFKYKTKIGLQEVYDFVYSVVNNCFDTDKKTGLVTYNPYAKELMFYKNLVEKYTDIILPANLKDFYNCLQISEMRNTLDDLIIDSNSQINEIESCIYEAIEFKKQEILANKTNSTLKELQTSVDVMTTGFSGLLDSFTKFLNTANTKLEDFSLIEFMQSNGIDKDALLKSFSNTNTEIQTNEEYPRAEVTSME